MVDDCSTDKTVPKVEAVSATGPGVRLQRLAVNQGTYVARNKGIGLTSADFLTDDWSMQDRIAMQIDLLSSRRLLRVYAGYVRAGEDDLLDTRSILPAQREVPTAPVQQAVGVRSPSARAY